MKTYFVYIMASKKNGTLYIGVTNNLARRVWEHKHDIVEGFTKKYGVHQLGMTIGQSIQGTPKREYFELARMVMAWQAGRRIINW